MEIFCGICHYEHFRTLRYDESESEREENQTGIAGSAVQPGDLFYRGNGRDQPYHRYRKRRFLAAVLYQGIGCSVFAFFLSNAAIAKIGVNRTSSFIGVSTTVSILTGVIVLKEAVSVFQLLGAAVIIAGVYTANSRTNVQEL